MQSRTSFFNKTLFKKNLTRFWPLWGMASFGGALFPLALLVNILHGNHGFRAIEMREMYYNVLVYGVPVISIVYAILCAIAVWSYLYSARSVGMMHTLPMGRSTQFFTNVLSGMTMMAIPYAVTGGLTVLVSVLCGGFDLLGTLVTVGGVICDSFFFFGLATLCAMVVGNTVALPVLYGLLNFIAVLTDMTVNLLAQGFIFGISSIYSGQVKWLSPVVYMMEKVGVNIDYEEYMEAGDIWGTSRLRDVTLENGYVLVIYGLVGLVLLAGAFVLYRNRRSESAGDVVSVRALKPVFRYGVAAYAAVLGGRLLYALFEEAYSSSEYLEIIPMIVCMFVAGAIGYYAASMILAKSARVFTKKSFIGLAAVAVGCAALCVSMGLDVFGISKNVPAADQIDTLEIYVANNRYTLRGDRDAELIEAVRGAHKSIVDGQDLIKQEYNDHAWREDAGSSYAWLDMTYTLKSGIEVKRTYSLVVNKDRMFGDPDSYDYVLNELVNSTVMRQRRIHADDGAEVTGGWVNLFRGPSVDLSSREAQTLLDALKQDAAEGTWGTYDWFNQDNQQAYAMDLELYFQLPDAEEGYRSRDTIDITIWPDMKHTVAALLELGLIDESDLITREEYDRLNDWQYGSKFPQATEDYEMMDPDSMPDYSYSTIGGADAAAAVVVVS